MNKQQANRYTLDKKCWHGRYLTEECTDCYTDAVKASEGKNKGYYLWRIRLRQESSNTFIGRILN